MRAVLATCLGAAVLTSPAFADSDRYHITPVEQAACLEDATAYCAYTYPNEDLLLACMRSNVSRLGMVCHSVFMAGLKRRHLL